MGNLRVLARWGLIVGVLSVLAAPARAASGDAQYYVSLGTSLAVGIQPDAHGKNQPTQDGYSIGCSSSRGRGCSSSSSVAPARRA